MLDGAPVEKAAIGLIAGGYNNTGQTCISIERVYVQDSVYEPFVKAAAARIKALKLGYSLGFDLDMGSLISEAHAAKVSGHIEDAVAKGAEVLAGGHRRNDLGPAFVEPTLITGVMPNMRMFKDETFGPVVAVYRVRDADEAVRLANDSDYGLNASVWGGDGRVVREVSRRLETGSTGINSTLLIYHSFDVPMGGVKASGLGRRHGRHGILRYTQEQSIVRSTTVGGGYESLLVRTTTRKWARGLIKLFRIWRRIPVSGRPTEPAAKPPTESQCEPTASSTSASRRWQLMRREVRRLHGSWLARRAIFLRPAVLTGHPERAAGPGTRRAHPHLALARGLLRRRDVVQPAPAPMSALRRAHSDAYLDAISNREPWFRCSASIPAIHCERILALQRRMAGGTIAACRTALASGGIGVNLGGGFHHAHRDRGQGFCAYNDLAMRSSSCARGFTGKVMVVDLDLHDGDGTRAIFAADETVFTFSIHNQPWGPPEALASFSLALGTAIDDARYLAAIREHLPRCFDEFSPDLVIYVAGADPAADDRLGDWQISNAGMLERDRVVFGLARGTPRSGHPLPMVVVLAGGYGPDAWRHAARLFSLISSNGRRALEPVSTSEIVLHRYRQMARLLSSSALSGESGTPAKSDDWELAPEDLAGLGGAPHETRFLGFYTLEGL